VKLARAAVLGAEFVAEDSAGSIYAPETKLLSQIHRKKRFMMNSTKQTARIAGCLYLLVIVFGVFALMYVRPSLIVPGDAATTAARMMASESLFRIGVVSELLMYTCFLLLPLPLYVLLKPVSKPLASLMVIFVFVSVPIGMLNTLNNFAALSFLSGDGYLTVFTTQQLQAQMMNFLNLYDLGYLIGQIFFGLWLIPLGYLAFKSGYFPKILGVLVIIGGFAQLVDTFTSFLFPSYQGMIITVLGVFGFSEILFCLWLLTIGVKIQRAQALPSAA
jgi:hypothetical protein